MTEKLIRDGVPAIAEATGHTMTVRVADKGEMVPLLRAKLLEEVTEVVGARSPAHTVGELADVLEVVIAYAEALGYTQADFQGIADQKRQRRGGFTRWLVWDPENP